MNFKRIFLILLTLLNSQLAIAAYHPDGSIVTQKEIGVFTWQSPFYHGPYFVHIKKIIYWSDDLKINGYVAYPDVCVDLLTCASNKKFPVIIWNRGGNRSLSAITDTNVITRFAWIASFGYIVLASNYRGSPESEGHDEYGGRDVNDILNLFPLAQSFKVADINRIGMMGFSRGGMMSYLILQRNKDIKIAILNSGLVDLAEKSTDGANMDAVFSETIPNYSKGYLTDKLALLAQRSAIAWPAAISKKTKIVILYGAKDKSVMPDQQIKMAQKLKQTGHSVDILAFAQASHGLPEYEDKVKRLTIYYLNKYLK